VPDVAEVVAGRERGIRSRGPDHARREIDVAPRLFARQLGLFAVRNRRAKTRITLSAKKGVWLTRKRNCFCPTGTSFTSPAATAVALRGASSMSAISPENPILRYRLDDAVADADFHVPALDNEELARGIPSTEDRLTGLERTAAGTRQQLEIDFRHVPPAMSRYELARGMLQSASDSHNLHRQSYLRLLSSVQTGGTTPAV
jgi:hypothetical protein